MPKKFNIYSILYRYSGVGGDRINAACRARIFFRCRLRKRAFGGVCLTAMPVRPRFIKLTYVCDPDVMIRWQGRAEP